MPVPDQDATPPGWDEGWERAWDARRAAGTAPGLVPVRVVRIDKGGITVAATPADKRLVVAAKAVRRVVVGDVCGLDPEAGRIEVILPRRTVFERRAPGAERDDLAVGSKALAANMDVVLVLQAPRLFTLARTAQEEKFRHRTSVATKEFRILVVDDSVSTRHVEKNILEAQGYQVELAADGVEGFEKAMEKPYDLILTDIEMPRMDGFTLTEALRQEKTYRHTPIIILSSRGSEEDKLRGMQVGANGYLVKGAFDPQQLTDTINKLMQ